MASNPEKSPKIPQKITAAPPKDHTIEATGEKARQRREGATLAGRDLTETLLKVARHSRGLLTRMWYGCQYRELENCQQSVFLVLWEQRDRIAAADDPEAFAYGVARNVIREFVRHGLEYERRVQLRGLMGFGDEGEDGDGLVLADDQPDGIGPGVECDGGLLEVQRLAENVIAALPDDQRVVFESRRAGQTRKQMAEAAGWTETRVRYLLAQADKRVWAVLEAQGIQRGRNRPTLRSKSDS